MCGCSVILCPGNCAVFRRWYQCVEQPARQSIQLCPSHTPVQPELHHTCQHAVQLTRCIPRGCSGVISPPLCTGIYLGFRPLFLLPFADVHPARQHHPLPSGIVTPPFQAVPLPKAKLQQVIQAGERAQVPHDPWFLQLCAAEGPGGTASSPRGKGRCRQWERSVRGADHGRRAT